LAACGNHMAPLPTTANTVPVTGNAHATGIESVLFHTTSPPTPHIYVGDYYGSDVTIFKYTASGDATPYHTIVGADTGLTHPSAIAVDSTGQIYVGNYLIVGANIEVYAPGASGDAVPVKTLTGPMGFNMDPNQFAIDPSDDLYVAETEPRIDVFAPTATATSAPVRSIQGSTTKLVLPSGVALDASQNVYVCDASANAIFKFAAGATGDVAPIASISGKHTGLDHPDGITLDGNGRIYVSQAKGHDVEEFAAGAHGNVAPLKTYAPGTESPTSIGWRASRIFVTEISVPTYSYAVDVLDTGTLSLNHSIEGSATGLDWGDAVTAR
jgi:hypothetical protein